MVNMVYNIIGIRLIEYKIVKPYLFADFIDLDFSFNPINMTTCISIDMPSTLY